MKKIPRKIHQIYTAGWDALPDEIKALAHELQQKNPAWAYRFYDDQAITNYIGQHFGPDTLALYQRINPEYGAARADLFRYLVMYNEGGVYLDIKSSCDRPLDDIIPEDCELILCHWDNGPQGLDIKKGLHPELSALQKGEYQQWNIIAGVRSPYLKAVIDDVTERIRNYRPWTAGIGMKGVLRTTGPIAYTLAIGKIPAGNEICYVENHRDIGLIYCGVGSTVLKRVKKSAYARLKTPIVTLDKKDYAKYQLWLFFIHPVLRLYKNIINEACIAMHKVRQMLPSRKANRADKTVVTEGSAPQNSSR
ncbi:glycosyltransferase family 32 protein [Chania multitudinisentens]|uniref:glycosyltransferase family 32 protein n=1 Tax=Chania multitudinisentens TaxID=1639108 RepID=UPI0003E14787|nr:glycosyltransferase [Chania multitudinisentens]